MQVEQVVIAGAGLAGLRTAEELRARGYTGVITMIGAERRLPYDRPPLTKKFMTGELDDTSLRPDMTALGVDLRLGATATGLRAGVLRTDQGEHAFGALVVTTGAAPVRLPGGGPQRVLRTLDDAMALRSALRPGVKLAVVGAGWIGAELATSAARRGCQVTGVEAAPAPLAGALGTEVGSRTEPWYAAAGRARVARRRLASRGRDRDGSGRPARGELARWNWRNAGKRGGGRRGTARVGARRVRGGRLRGIRLPPVPAQAARGALGQRHPRARGGGGEH